MKNVPANMVITDQTGVNIEAIRTGVDVNDSFTSAESAVKDTKKQVITKVSNARPN